MSTLSRCELLQKTRDVIDADAVLQAWCQAQFSRNAKTYLFLDERKPPPSSDYPAIAISRISHSRATDSPISTFRLFLVTVLEKTGYTSSGNKRTLDMALFGERLCELAEDALYRGLVAALVLGSDDGRVEIRSDKDAGPPDATYPEYAAWSWVTVEVEREARAKLP
jgi:hypothetical protein